MEKVKKRKKEMSVSEMERKQPKLLMNKVGGGKER
jgi:hypothetical protein